ncbi:MAG TPA: Spy/CpxP family protein refolding chaperone [Thermoanaerobaculia bacterium]|nr:Spy/CpxP family protein refolding chaperone [Thermoanaerobaculia bacterium]
MKKRTILIASILALGVIVAAPLVIAGPHGHGARTHGGPMAMHGMEFLGHLQHVKEEIGLTDAQAEQIHAIFREVHEQNTATRDDFHAGLHEAAQILLANPNDVAAAQAVLDRQAAAERVLKTNLLTAFGKAFAVLTPDQRTKLRTMMDERHGALEK